MKALLIIPLFSLAVIFNVSGQAKPQEMLNKAIYQEEVNGNLEEAIKLFLEIVDKNSTNRAVTAEAFYRLGLINEKLGYKKAIGYYEKVIHNFGDQPEFVRIAKERLNRLILLAEKEEKIPLTPIFTKIQIPSGTSWNMHLSPDGQKVSLVSDKKLWIMPLVGQLEPDISGAPLELNTQGVRVEGAHTWSGDGNWIAFNEDPLKELAEENKGKLSMYVVSSKGGIPKKVFENYRDQRTVNYRISLSPDGKTLAFSSVDLDSKEQHIYTIPIDGDSPKQLVDAQAREPVFSPDGKMIAFVEDKNMGRGGGDLWVVPAQGGIPKHIAEAVSASSPVWSPKGDMMVFLDYGKKRNQINFITIGENGEAAGDVITINAPEGIDGIWRLTGWSPDNKIGVIFEKGGETGLYTLPTKGGKAMQVSRGGGQPRWSPNGERIFCINFANEKSGGWQGLAIGYIPAEGGSFTTIPIQSDVKIRIPNFGAGNRISQDGKMIVFSGKTQKDPPFYLHNHIWTLPVEGGTAKQLTEAPEQTTDMFPCWSPDGKAIAFVRARIPHNASEISDMNTNIYISQVNTGRPTSLTTESDRVKFGPIEWSPDGKFIAFFSQEDDTSSSGNLKIISANGDTKSRVIGKVKDPHPGMQFAWSPDSKRIAFDGPDGKVIKIISLDDGSIVNIETGLVGSNIGDRLDWSPDGERFVFVGGKGVSNEFWMIENFLPLEKLPQKKEKEDIVIRKFMDGTGSVFYGAPSPDGKYFSFIDYGTYPNDIVIKEIGTVEEIRLRNQTDLSYEGDEGTPYNPIWSPDSKQIAYVWENDKDNFYELRVIEVDNSEPDVLIRVSYSKGWIKTEDWSPDGQHILVQLTQNNQDKLGLVSIVDGSFQQLKKIGKTAPYSAKFSPDGKNVAYDNPPNEENLDHDIFVLSIEGKRETKITSHPSHDYFLYWSPSGGEIFFGSDRTGTTDMWSISFDEEITNKDPKLVTENIGNIGPLGSTRNGSFYFSTPGSWWDIYTVTIDPESGKVTTPPTEIPLPYQGYNYHPAWSPDGKYLAYVSVRRHLRQPNILCIYSKQKGSIKEFVYEHDVNHPVWFPDSRSILLFGTDILDIATGELTPYIQLKKDEEVYNIIISSDNKYIYYATRDKNWKIHSIIRRNLGSGEEKELYRTTDANLTMALSPDGKQLAVMLLHNENTRILKILSTMERSEKDIYSFKYKDFGYKSIAWSPDGKYIYFSKRTGSEKKRPDELCRILATGGDAENLGVNMLLFTNISIHPNGQLITFNSFVGKEKPGGVWVMENFLPED